MPLSVEVLEQSFNLIKPHAIEFASSFYSNLLTDYPQAQPLFANTDMTKQEEKLTNALVLVVENLRKPDVLSDVLEQLGVKHAQYGTLPEHYPLVGGALLRTFESYLGSNWTPEVRQAWTNAYGVITTLMLEGAGYLSETFKSEHAPQ